MLTPQPRTHAQVVEFLMDHILDQKTLAWVRGYRFWAKLWIWERIKTQEALFNSACGGTNQGESVSTVLSVGLASFLLYCRQISRLSSPSLL